MLLEINKNQPKNLQDRMTDNPIGMKALGVDIGWNDFNSDFVSFGETRLLMYPLLENLCFD